MQWHAVPPLYPLCLTEAEPAELIRIEATLWGRFYPVFKEASHASQCGLGV
jgi:hypothetical protein